MTHNKLILGLMLACITPAFAQQNLISNGSFEQLRPNGSPADWELLGSARVESGEAHTGRYALHLVRSNPDGEVGLNREWKPNSGTQMQMLAARNGGIRFWYKAVSADPNDALMLQVIPMNDKSLEAGGHRTVWRVPPANIDGQWRQGIFAYDYRNNPEVKWVHVGARIGGKRGEMWLDDFEWVSQTGPILQAVPPVLTETAGHEGADATVSIKVSNLGDQALHGGEAILTLPDGLTTATPRMAMPVIEPGKYTEISWRVTGKRQDNGQQLQVTLRAAGQEMQWPLSLRAKLTLARLELSRMIVKAGEPVLLKLVAGNEGNAIAAGFRSELKTPAGVEAIPVANADTANPATETTVATWRIRATKPAASLRLQARIPGIDGETAANLVVCDRLPQSMPTTGAVFAAVRGEQAVVGTAKTRLILSKGRNGFGVGILQTRGARGWETVAWLPRLGLLALPGGETILTATQARAEQGKDSARLLLDGTAKIAGQAWRLHWELSARTGGESVGFSMQATPSKSGKLLALEGPMLYAGEGTKTVREDAIVPGLEWLVRGEESSNALDFNPVHPDCIRYVPHPYKVTVPAVGVRLGNTTVGLLWDIPTQQPSFKQAGPLSLVFASPNRFEGYQNHLMGLFLPSVGNWVPENTRRASTPLPVAGGKPLALRAELLAVNGAKDSLAALDRWYARHGFPEPLPYPRGDLRGEIAFSLSAYFKDRALWNPEWNQWYSDLIVGFRPTLGPANDLLRGAEYLKTGPVAANARALAAEVLAQETCPLEQRLQHRADPNSLRDWAKRARKLISSQQPDGTWRFSGEKAGEWPAKGVNYAVLGPVGASEVGLTAPPATEVLEFALVTGDVEARAAGLKALAAMRQFRVPRAAQVWEVPVHTPDILASARAVSAYLAGYRLTGERQYLQDAVYWARTGLPFVYVWNMPNLPAMRGASIPVFGGTGYMLSWLGVGVQWNGLAYAESLLDLSEYDHSFPWRRVAEELVRSGMYQQATKGERLGQWPDAYNFIEGRKGPHGSTPPCFQPATILRLSFRLMGQKTEPVAVVVRQGAKTVTLRGAAAFSGAKWIGNALQFTAKFTLPQQGGIEVIGVGRPTAVLLDGKPLPEETNVWAGRASGWHWHADVADLEIRVAATGAHQVTVKGATAMAVKLSTPLRRSMDFRFAEDGVAGWNAAHDLSPLTVRDGCLSATTQGEDPYLVRDDLWAPGHAEDVLVLRLSSAGGGNVGSIFWDTEQEPGFSPRREIPFSFRADGEMQTVRIPVGKHPGWSGKTITSLRIDPGGGAAKAAIRIESIKLEAPSAQ